MSSPTSLVIYASSRTWLEQQNLVPIFFHSLGLKGQKYTVSHVQIYLHDTWHAFFTLLPNSYFCKDEVRLPVPHFEAYFVTYRISALLSSLLSEKVLKSWFACRGNCIEIQLPRVVYTKLQSGYWSRMDDKRLQRSQWLKITEKVSFIIASEASYVYILTIQKWTKNDQKGQFWRVFECLKLTVKQCYQIGQK